MLQKNHPPSISSDYVIFYHNVICWEGCFFLISQFGMECDRILLVREGYVISLLLLLVKLATHLMFLRNLVERLIHMLIFHLYQQPPVAPLAPVLPFSPFNEANHSKVMNIQGGSKGN
ncbi:hypothetical protein AFK74_09880 [Bacillus amyloliquefaciens]|nr:hypothetical protein AFK74_09880 [Bacillus amyloliquefaciens]